MIILGIMHDAPCIVIMVAWQDYGDQSVHQVLSGSCIDVSE